MQDKVFSLISHSNKEGCLKFLYKAPKAHHTKPDRSEQDHPESNHGLHHQIIMGELCSSEILHSNEW